MLARGLAGHAAPPGPPRPGAGLCYSSSVDYSSRLAEIPLFAEMSPRELEALAPLIRRQHVPAGSRVFSEGDPGDAMYLIDKGRIRISKVLSGVGEEALAILGPGGVFGEMAVLDGGQRSADAIAQEDAELFVLERERFLGLLKDDKDLAFHVLSAIVRTLVGRLRAMNDKVLAFYVLAQFC